MDESGINRKIGAATYNPTTNRVTQQHLGSEAQYNVFTAEAAALMLAAETLRDDNESSI